MTFGEVLEAAGTLVWDDQDCLVDTLRRQVAEQRREQIAQDVEAALAEFRAGKCRPVTADELFNEIVA
jgi:hypothetical protein